MSCEPVIALAPPTQPVGFAVMAVSLTAVIKNPASFLFGFLRKKMAAKISNKTN